MSEDHLNKIVSKFNIEGNVIDIAPFGDGLINATFLVSTKSGDEDHKYILQRINQYVFPEPWKVMANLSTVNQHIKSKVDDPESTTSLVVTQEVKTKSEEGYNLVSDDDEAWRIIDYIPDTRTIKTAESTEVAFEAACAFGKFDNLLSDLKTDVIHTTIPGYHGYSNRLEKLDAAINKNEFKRVAVCKDEIDITLKRRDYLMRMNHLIESGHAPRRVTHNDTKIDNVLFDSEGNKAVGVIDLDTVMPATILYDFGDMVRFNCNTAREDIPDIDSIHFKMDIFKGIAEGFLQETTSFLKITERKNLVFGGLFFTWIQAVRFLTDYLMGDVYYRTDHPEHNLDRTINQLTYLKLMEDKRADMERIIEKIK